MSQLHTLPSTADFPEESASELVPATASDLSDSPTASAGIVARREKWRTRPKQNCILRPCSCVCHLTNRTTRRFWALEYTPWGAFQQSCDLETCNTTKYGASVRLAFSQFGIRWAAVLEVYAITSAGRFSFRPNLELEQIVPYTSPGFEIIWKCRTHKIEFEEARESLGQLYRADPQGFRCHVNPAGKSYIEVGFPEPKLRPYPDRRWR